MAVVLEIDESNGGTETVTDGITQIVAGSLDQQSNTLTPGAAPLTPGTPAYEKWLRFHFTALGGAAGISTLKVWAAAPPAEHTFQWNGHTIQATYASANHVQTTYAAAATSTTRTPEILPTSEPTSANVGIAGLLAGSLSAVGRSDYILLQVRPTALALAGSTIIVSFGYQIVA
jgi:hypothetical protein